ncbi:type I-E CRISPR-associated protein Cse1/CasA [Umezawaea sp. Da 62-37]|uniref:type I-E CRISPR-associated protein Cse1/CasA n=1 Tax=Umezawaea sp. Da 62-37 TaxID=3075927 RepID=UPI0028F71B73|nr:type I-E CRISPR-associated protein Cse1/CasA [Umezawaea sp. Da 62-37]WNV85006.1 type I-E CRISPR-associated protein Cse1/CasA [Umezawaea sp. Da 62-37]
MNLLDDPWIPVRIDNTYTEVSGRDAILRAHEIQQLSVDVPTMLPVILRQFLLPIVLDALGAPRTIEQWKLWMRASAEGLLYSGAQPPPLARETDADTLRSRNGVLRYLADYHDRFELFHPEHPFAQVAGLRTTNDDTKSTSLLVPSVASGNNVPLFSNRTGDEPAPLRAAEAARWLLHAHCWDTAAIKTGAAGDSQAKNGKTTGNPTGPLGQLGVVIPIGRTLAETLMLNVPLVRDGLSDQDLPQWRRAPWTAEWKPGRAVGWLQLLTWQARRIRLHHEDGPDGRRVTSVVVSAGDRLTQTPAHEPHTLWRNDSKAKAGEPTLRPRRHMSGRAAWQGLDALLAVDPGGSEAVQTSRQLQDLAAVLEPDFPLQVCTVGVEYGNQSAVVENVIADSIPLPVAALRDSEARYVLIEIADQVDRVVKAVNLLSVDLRRTTGSEPIPWDKGQRPGDRLLHALDPVTRLVLHKLQRRSDHEAATAVHLAWEQTAWRIARDIAEPLLRDVSPRQFTGLRTTYKDKEILLCSPKAELAFRRRVSDALPLAAEVRKRRDPDQES